MSAEIRSLTFEEELKESGITQAVIIDDIFEEPSLRIITDVASFWTAFTDNRDDHPKLNKIFQEIETSDQIEDRHVAECWALFKSDQETDLLKGFFGDYPQRKCELERLTELLTQLCQEPPLQLTPDQRDQIPADTKLVFLDYYLGTGESATQIAIEIATELARRQPRPYLVLISDSDQLEERSSMFRHATHYMAGTFAHLSKERAVDRAELTYSLASWGLGNSALRVIQPLFDAMITSVDEAAEAVKSAMRALTLQDYSLLQNASLVADGQPLGEYITDLFGASISYRFRNTESLRSAKTAADNAPFEKYLPLSFPPSHSIVTLYQEAITEPSIERNISHHPWSKNKANAGLVPSAMTPEADTQPVDAKVATIVVVDSEAKGNAEKSDDSSIAWLALGDIFSKDKKSPLLMILNAGCDLQFSPERRKAKPDRSILLIEGNLYPISDSSIPDETARTEFFKFEQDLYRINWSDRVRTIKHADFKAQMNSEGYNNRIARLSLPYALQIQQAWLASMGRVGLSVAPPHSDCLDVEIYKKGEGEGEIPPTLVTRVKSGATVIRHKRDDANYARSFLLSHEALNIVRAQLKTIKKALTQKGGEKSLKKATTITECIENLKIWRSFQEEPREVKLGKATNLCNGILKASCEASVKSAELADCWLILLLKESHVSTVNPPEEANEETKMSAKP